MWMAFAAPALADNDRYDDNRIHNWWLDNDKRHDDYWFDYDGIILVSDNDFDDFYPYPYWGFYPLLGFLPILGLGRWLRVRLGRAGRTLRLLGLGGIRRLLN